tara:strand:- start:70090 stop:70332 length:243 start_codon:yes stop_codon:yes gene_type:complete
MNKALLIEQIALQAGISVEEANFALEKFEEAMKSFDEGRSSYELLVDSLSEYTTPKDDLLYQEPLWVRDQQNKTFKRGKQ